MPEIQTPPQFEDIDLDDKPFDLERRLLSEAHTLNLVVKTFNAYETERDATHPQRWANLEQLYYGRVKQRYWPGTKTPRAALGIPVVFEQEESLLPALEGAIFQQFPYWFGVEGIEGFSSPQEAQQVGARLAYWFETPRDSSGRTTSDVLCQSLQQGVHLGNYAAQVGWADGFFCDYVDIRDLYVDPKLKSPYMDDSSSIIHRVRMTIKELKANTSLDLPPDPVLNFLAKNRELSQGDMARALAEAYRGASNNPDALDPDPAKQDIDVLIYWTNGRVCWVLGKSVLAFNEENEYGFKPFIGGPLIPSMASWYGAAVGDFVEGEQRLQQGLINTRLDELALNSDPPRYRKRGAFAHPSAMHYRPGLVDQLDKPKDDIVVQYPQGMTQNNYVEAQLSEARASKRMGISDIGMSGAMARPAATRTAAGVALQNSGAANRLYMPIKRVERYLIAPLLHKAAALIAKYDTEAGQLGLFIDDRGKRQVNPVSPGSLQKRVRFRLSAASKALSQAKQQAALPTILQTYLAGPFVQALSAIGRTPDTEQIDRFVMEATGTLGAFTFTREMSQQEQQAKTQPSAEAMMKAQLAQQSNQTRVQVAQAKNQSDTEIQAEKSAIAVLEMISKEKNLDKELRAQALKAIADIQVAQEKAREEKSGGST